MKWWIHMPQKECNNDCDNTTLPDSVIVKIIRSAGEKDTVLKDTGFTCSQYHLDGDDIELPTITLE